MAWVKISSRHDTDLSFFQNLTVCILKEKKKIIIRVIDFSTSLVFQITGSHLCEIGGLYKISVYIRSNKGEVY